MLTVSLSFFNKKAPSLLSIALKLIDFIEVPSSATNIDLICLSPTMIELIFLILLIMNFGSGFPDPNGDKQLILS